MSDSKSGDTIFVTKPFLPPIEEFQAHVQDIWDSEYLTNCGPKHQQLERELATYLGVEHLALFTNGALALIAALQVLDVKGEVITTPFSFVATSNALVWNNNKPVFVDIDPVTLNMDPAAIEAAITEKTSAIMPVHCYGNPCDVDAIQAIADKYKLKVIYDAAHAFGVHDEKGSILARGDMAMLSFHATKVFNTFEGGALICKTAEQKAQIDQLKNFGIEDEITVSAIGANGKMSEIHAAMGLTQLNHIDRAIAERGAVDTAYREAIEDIDGLHVLPKLAQTVSNYSYFPLLVQDDYPLGRDALYDKMKEYNILTRRYFYPLIPEFSVYKDLPSASPDNLPVATKMALQVLCLPIYAGLGAQDVARIINVLRDPT